MTDHLPPLSDEDLSAALDGEADAGVAERIAHDPDAQARSAELAAVRDAIGAPVVPLPGGVVDDLVGSALDAAGEGAADSDDTDPDDRGTDDVVPLPRSTRSGTGSPRWLVAAAILAVLAIGLGLVWRGTRTDTTNDQASSGASNTATADANAGAGLERAPATTAPPVSDKGAPDGGDGSNQYDDGEADTKQQNGSTTDASGADQPTLGRFATVAAFRKALATEFPLADAGSERTTASETASWSSTDAFERCATELAHALPVTGDPRHTGSAVIGDRRALVYEYATTADDGKATTLVAAVGPTACDPITIFQR